MSNPNVGLLEEIDDQDLGDLNVGAGVGINATLWSITECIVSLTIGDPGHACTLTVECQKTCN